MNDKEMLDCICQDAEMGRDAVSHVLKLTEDADLRQLLGNHLSGYQETYLDADKLLHQDGLQPKNANPVAKMMTYVSSNMKTMTDHSPSKIAELVIQGNTMGITTMTKHIHDYDGTDRSVLNLAKKQIRMEQQNIDELKAFL